MAVIEYDAQGWGHNESGKRIAETMSVVELFRMFPDEDACYAWLERVRWHGEPVCPHCGGVDNIVPDKRKRHYRHKDCRKRFTVTTHTCMHATKRPLQDWIYAIYSVMTARKGVSAMQLSKELGVQYRTAWHMLHRIREACGKGEFQLSNTVEVDETYVGGLEKNKHWDKKLRAGRGPVGKTAVAGVRERDGEVRAKPVAKTDSRTLVGFVAENVAHGTTIYSDEATAYRKLGAPGSPYAHDTVRHGIGEYVRGDVHTNGIESVWAVLKRSINGTWHHVSPKHMARYVNEATFRLNGGNCEVDTIVRMESFAGQVGGKRLPYADLVKPNGLSNVPEEA